MVLVPVSSLLALSTLAVAHPRPHDSSSSSLSSRHATKKPITIPLPPRAKRSSKPNKNSSASDTKSRSRSRQVGPSPYSDQDGSSQAMLAGRGEDGARRAQTHDTPLFKASKSKGQPLQYVGTKHAPSHNKRATTASCSSLGSAAAGYLSIVTPTTVQPETPAPLANLMLSKPANATTPPSFLLNAASASYSTLLMITEGPPDPAANGTVPVMFAYPASSGAGAGCLCVSANLGDTDDQHPPLALVPCDPEDASQQFALEPEMGFVSPLMVDTHAAAAAAGSGNATTTATATATTTAKPTKRALAIPAPVTTVSAAEVVSSVSASTSVRSALARVEDVAPTKADALSAKSPATALRVDAGVASISMDPTTETVPTTDALPTTLIDNEVNGVAVNTMYTSDSTLTTLASTTATASTTVTDYVPLPTPPRGCNGKENECSDEDEDEGESTYDPCEGEGENCGKAKILGTRKVVGTPVELVEPYRYVFVLLDDSQAQDPNSKPAGQDSDSGVV